jgi:large subunit ribosomal protein L21
VFAVVETGGKQYKVAPGDQLDVERLSTEDGEQFDLGRVLMVGNDSGQVLVGTPIVEGARVVATVVTEHRGDKIIVFKYKAKKRYRLKMGHRQTLTRISIDEVIADGIADSQAEVKAAPTKAKAAKRVAAPAKEQVAAEETTPVAEVAAPVEETAPIAQATTGAEETTAATDVATPEAAGAADLEWVDGIGPVFNRVLGEHGIVTTEDLAGATVEQLHAAGINRDDEVLASWIQQAKDRLAGK